MYNKLLNRLEQHFKISSIMALKSQNCGFTLAEVLITLGIIGVVAAMTIPSLITSYQVKLYSNLVKKDYALLTQGMRQYMAEQQISGFDNEVWRSSVPAFNQFWRSAFKVTKDCNGKYVPCFAENYKNLDDLSGRTINIKNGRCNVVIQLMNGMAICADAVLPDLSGDDKDAYDSYTPVVGEAMDIEFDINGPEGPNIFGVDFFTASIRNDGTIYDKFYEKSGFYAHKSAVNSNKGALGKIQADGWKITYPINRNLKDSERFVRSTNKK